MGKIKATLFEDQPTKVGYVKQLEYVDRSEFHETVTGESMTEPGQAYTLKEILERHKANTEILVGEPQYNAESPDDFDAFDTTKLGRNELIDVMTHNQAVQNAIDEAEQQPNVTTTSEEEGTTTIEEEGSEE